MYKIKRKGDLMSKLKLNAYVNLGSLKSLLISAVLVAMSACGDDCNSDPNNVAGDTGSNTETSNSSDFVTGVDGWTIEGDAKGGTGVIPNFSEINGVGNSGYIYAKDDVTGGVWYFVAPSKYHGDKSTLFNGKIEFYLIQDSSMTNQFDANDVIIEGTGGEKLILKHESYPTNSWTQYKINLNTDSQWLDENNNIASDEKIKRVLSIVSKIMIRGEFEDGEDTGGLDGFKFIEGNAEKG